MKEMWKEEIRRFEELHCRGVNKADFAGVFGRAYARAFNKDTVEAAFRATGVHPFNPDIITAEQMKPSMPSSTKDSFPLPQPSPVRAVIAAFRSQPPTLFDTDPSTHSVSAAAGPSGTPHPAYKRTIDSVVDPELYTPSKRIRLLTSALSSTTSGSYLVDATRMTSSHPICAPVFEAPPPLPSMDWSILHPATTSGSRPTRPSATDLQAQNVALTQQLALAQQHIRARDLVIEGTQAQLIVQNLTMMKQNQALHAKENKKTADRTRLFADGMPRVLTGDQFSEEIRKADERRKAEEAGRRRRAKTREEKKAAKAALEERWRGMLEEHRGALEVWTVACTRLEKAGVRKKNWPTKPLRPRKPVLEVELDEDEEDVEIEERSSDVEFN